MKGWLPGGERTAKQMVEGFMERLSMKMEVRKKQKKVQQWFKRKLPSCFKKTDGVASDAGDIGSLLYEG